MIAMPLLSDLKTYWALRSAEDAIACAEYKLEWETAEWNTFFGPNGGKFPNGETRRRTDYIHDEDSLNSIRQMRREAMEKASHTEEENHDSVEAKEALKHARRRFFQADRDLATLHAARAYYYGRMQSAKRELDERRGELAKRDGAKERIRSRFTLRRLKRSRKMRKRFTRGEKLTIYSIIVGVVVAIVIAILGLWVSGGI